MDTQQLYQQALNLIPGGVNSPVRACKSVGATPLFIDRADGSHIFDADGNRFIDYIGSWGPMILGHRHPAVIEAIAGVLQRGTSFGAPMDLEIQLAQMVIDAYPSVAMVRMVNSGTEATMSAVRLSRAATNRQIVVKFDGCYHGHGDSLLVEAGSGVATLSIPGSPGVPGAFVSHTLSLPFNDLESLHTVMEKQGDKIACVIIDPLPHRIGLIRATNEFVDADNASVGDTAAGAIRYGNVCAACHGPSGNAINFSA